MQVQSINCYANNVYNNRNSRMQKSNMSFKGITTNEVRTTITGETFAESKRLALKAVGLCKKLCKKVPTVDGVGIVSSDYAERAVRYPNISTDYITPALNLCKKYGDKEAILRVKLENPVCRPDYEMVYLVVRDGKEEPIELAFNNTQNGIGCRKNTFDGMWHGYVDASEEEAQIFNKYVSDFLKSSEKLEKFFV